MSNLKIALNSLLEGYSEVLLEDCQDALLEGSPDAVLEYSLGGPVDAVQPRTSWR